MNKVKPSLATHVSILALISEPEKFNGKRIVTEGVFDYGMSDSSLYASDEWYKKGITDNAIVVRLKFSAKEVDHFVSMSGKYVLIEGTFSSMDCGELCQYSGSINNIDDIHLIGN